MRNRKWAPFTLIAVAAIALSAFAAACGDDDDDGNGDTTPVATETADGGAPTVAPTEPPAEETPDAEATEPADDEGATIETFEHDELGTILVDSRGFALYTFANDTAGSDISACVDGCAVEWPPLTVDGEPTAGDGIDGELGTIERADGTTQVTYNGLPLYLFASDTAPGQANGHEVGNIWFVATP